MLPSCHGLKRPHSVKLLFPSPHKCGKVHRSDGGVSRAPEIQSALDTLFLGAEMKSLLPEPFRCVQADGGGRAAARVSEQPPHQLFGRGRHRREVFSGEGKVASENIVGRLVVRVVKERRKPAERLSNMYTSSLSSFPFGLLRKYIFDKLRESRTVASGGQTWNPYNPPRFI